MRRQIDLATNLPVSYHRPRCCSLRSSTPPLVWSELPVAVSPDISVVVSTYQRPGHLRRCLASLAVQQGVAGQFEVIVVDDGSEDDTADVVAHFRRTAALTVRFCTHPHDGFQLARCRNSGIRSSAAPYLLFTDGDCIFPPDHLRRHLEARRVGVVRAGDCVRVDEPTSARINEDAIRNGAFVEMIDASLKKSLRKVYLKSLGYQFVRHSNRPKLVGWNMAVWRDQLERINGFDEKFRGWGCEDDDLAARLRKSGARVATVLGYTHAYHLWHPPHPSTPQQWQDGPNVAYLKRSVVLTRCLEGIRSRNLLQVSTRVIGSPEQPEISRRLHEAFRESAAGPELELLVWPNQSQFTSKSSCRIVVAPATAAMPSAVARSANAVIRLDTASTYTCVIDGLLQAISGRAVDASTPPTRLRAA